MRLRRPSYPSAKRSRRPPPASPSTVQASGDRPAAARWPWPGHLRPNRVGAFSCCGLGCRHLAAGWLTDVIDLDVLARAGNVFTLRPMPVVTPAQLALWF
jgi:hypothetical protein